MLKKISEQEYVAFNVNGREYPILIYLKDSVEQYKFNFVKANIESGLMSAFQASKWCIHQRVAYAFINPYRLRDYFLRPRDVYRFYKTRFQNLWYKHEYEIGKADTSSMGF